MHFHEKWGPLSHPGAQGCPATPLPSRGRAWHARRLASIATTTVGEVWARTVRTRRAIAQPSEPFSRNRSTNLRTVIAEMRGSRATMVTGFPSTPSVGPGPLDSREWFWHSYGCSSDSSWSPDAVEHRNLPRSESDEQPIKILHIQNSRGGIVNQICGCRLDHRSFLLPERSMQCRSSHNWPPYAFGSTIVTSPAIISPVKVNSGPKMSWLTGASFGSK